jgi:sulfur relay (sulfurtransferase) complex TusBCD TusD component (DsrE family)
MANYLLIETKGPLDGGSYAFDLGQQLRELDHQVTVYLLQDGVFAARRTFPAGTQLLRSAQQHGLRVLADVVSCRQRGIVGDRVAPGVSVTEMDEMIDLLMERSDKAIWH